MPVCDASDARWPQVLQILILMFANKRAALQTNYRVVDKKVLALPRCQSSQVFSCPPDKVISCLVITFSHDDKPCHYLVTRFS